MQASHRHVVRECWGEIFARDRLQSEVQVTTSGHIACGEDCGAKINPMLFTPPKKLQMVP